MKNLGLALMGGLVMCAVVQGQAVAKAQIQKAAEVFFFESKVPQGFKATGASNITLSSRHFKDGKKSIQWQYKAGDKLIIKHHIPFQPFVKGHSSNARHSFASWIYNENPVADQMTFLFSTNGSVKSSFRVNMNFRGWRAVVVPFEEDMKGNPAIGMNQLTILPPKSQARGTVYFDQMALSVKVDPRWPASDYQVPYVNKTLDTRPNAHWSALMTYDRWLRAYDKASHAPATDAELQAMEAIMARMDRDILGREKTLSKKKLKFLKRQFTRYVTTVDNAKDLRLKPISLVRQVETFSSAGLKEEVAFINDSSVRLRVMGKYMLKLARGYHNAGNKKARQDIAASFVSIVHHMAEQGFMRGSSFGVMHHQGYSMKEWTKALYLMRDVLGGYRPAAQQAISWYMGLGRMLRPHEQIEGFNVDVMGTMLQGMLHSILMVPDEQQRVVYLRALGEWMNFSMLNHKGLAGGIQEDGSFYHHRQHYVAYGNSGLDGLSPVVYYLNNTPFEMNDEAYGVLRKGVLMSRVFSNDLRVPMSLSGRHPDGNADITLFPFFYLTLIETENATKPAESKVGAAYMRLLSLPLAQGAQAKSPLRKKLNRLGLKAEPIPEGSWVMNYSSLALHRREDWLASVRGFSRYLVGNESYRNANHYGRYMNYGHLEVLPADSSDRGFKEAGWDWNRWPGTTTIHLPFDKLAAHIIQEDIFSGHEQMLLSSESYSGGNHLAGRQAMFAMKLHGHPIHDDSFRARKSVFFFDDRIIALGSGIVNSDQEHVTQTTLFQDHLDKTDNTTAVGAKILSGTDTALNLTTAATFYLLDTNDNAYYLPAGQQVKILRQKQGSFENKHKKPTAGDFATAVISHGTSPDNGGYEYAILVGAGAEKAQKFATNMTDPSRAAYHVLQRDNMAHIVRDKATGIMAYALFEASENVGHGLLLDVDTPSMVMIKMGQDEVTMSVVDPDLGFFRDDDKTQFDKDGNISKGSIYSKKWTKKDPFVKKIHISLKGKWHKKDENPDYQVLSAGDDQTLIEVTSRAATPVQISLTRP